MDKTILILLTSTIALCYLFSPSIAENRFRTILATSRSWALSSCNGCVCGMEKRARITDGETTSVKNFPWLIRIMLRGLEEHKCGGSLITRNHAITAAHCFFEGYDYVDFYIITADGAKYTVKNVIEHKDFDHSIHDNDIAIVELNNPVQFNQFVHTICLPKSTSNYENQMATIMGWGWTSYPENNEDGVLSEDLQKADVQIIPYEKCKTETGYDPNRITKNMFCAGSLEGGKDACRGDSGGPLQVRGTNGNIELVGIVSKGRKCGLPKFPGVYTKVTNYLNWIKSNIRGECLCPPS